MTHEDTLRIVEQHWDKEVKAGGGGVLGVDTIHLKGLC